MTSGWGTPQVDKTIQGKPLSIAGKAFDKGVGTHANSVMYIALKKGASKFIAYVGVDDEVGSHKGIIEFRLYGDDRKLWSSSIMKAGEPAKKVNVNLEGVETLILAVNSASDGINYDHADWSQAKFRSSG